MNEQQMTETESNMERDLRRAVEIKAILETNKPLYDELDAITVRIAAAAKAVGSPAVLRAGGRVLTVVDNFESKNTVFRPCGVKRFELQVETEEEHAESLAKAAKRAAKAAK